MQTGDSTVMNLPVTGDPGYLVLNSAMPVDAEPVTAADWLQAYRRYAIEGGYPVQREDFDETNLVLELNLGSRLVSITKGCFPGQEVVARVVSRGKIPRKLTPLIFDEAETGASLAGKTLSLDGKTVGQIRRVFYSPGRERSIGVAYLKSNIADTPAPYEFQADESTVACEVDRLPLYLSPVFRKERDKLYNRGMEAYHADAYDEAEVCFRQALDLDRHHADSWEALAMSVEKRGDLDEAIRLNQRYGEADPMAVMAHTNLSRLYMLKGFKEKAEEEQGKAAMVEFKVQAAKKKGSAAETGKRLEQEEAARQKAEAERKMGIFKQVLEMDPEDEIANFGMGKLLLESGQPVRAIEHLQRVVDNNPDYSMAWQLLGQSLIKASKLSEAKEVLNSGLAAAERQGDMMPAKAIKQMLSLL
jgi:folate-binding protein YgfZ